MLTGFFSFGVALIAISSYYNYIKYINYFITNPSIFSHNSPYSNQNLYSHTILFFTT